MAKAWAQAFYHSPQWQAVRRIVLRRDHFTCADCCGRANEVHHIVELSPDNINDPNIALNPANLMAVELADFWNIDDDVEQMFADELGRIGESDEG